MHFNHTTPHILPTINTKPGFPGYYALIPILLILFGCAVAMVYYFRRRSRLDDLRHRLIPLYTYDPAEEQWDDCDREEDEEQTEPLYKKGKLSFSSDHGL